MASLDLLRTLSLCVGYFGAVAAFFAWSSRSGSSCLLPLESPRESRRQQDRELRWSQLLWPFCLVVGVIGAETVFTTQLAETIVPGLKCSTIFWPLAECAQKQLVDVSTNGAVILAVGSIVLYLTTRFCMREQPAYPLIVFVSGLLFCGAICDAVSGAGTPANVSLHLQLTTAIQLTAGAGFLLAILILQPRSILVAVCGTTAYFVSAAVRTLGFAATLSITKNLPAASATALWIVLMVLPGVAAALAPAAVMGVTLAPRRCPDG